MDKNGKRKKGSKKKVTFDTRSQKSFGVTLEDPPKEKKKKKITNKVKSSRKKVVEKVSLVKDMDVNIPSKEEDLDDEQTINDLIKEANKDRERFSGNGPTEE